MDPMTNFGKIIASLRREQGLTQERFASRLGITAQAVSKWETGTGLPDVAMMPQIARALHVPVGRLFAEPEMEVPEGRQIAEFWEGMPLRHVFQNMGCYSDKEVVEEEGCMVRFADGSTADLKNGVAINMGPGEIRIREAECAVQQMSTGTLIRPMETARDLEVELGGHVQVHIHACQTENRLEARGRQAFLAKLDVKTENDKWIVRCDCPGDEREPDQLDLYLPGGGKLDVRISGSGDVNVEPDFRETCLRVSGASQVKMLGDAGQMSVRVSGSGEVHAVRARDVQMQVSGSGDLRFERLTGSMELQTSGASSMICRACDLDRMTIRCSGASSVELLEGQVDGLDMHITGAATLEGRHICVKQADLQVSGQGAITLGRILEKSVERLGKECRLTVLHRGEK